MKTITFCFCLCCFSPFIGKSQTESQTSSGTKTAVYITISTDILKDFRINSELKGAGLTGFKQSAIGPSIGLNIPAGKGFFNVEGGVRSSLNRSGSKKSTFLRYLPASLGYYLPIFERAGATGFYIGGSYNIAVFNAEVFSKTSSIDLNNITQDDLQGALNLNAISHAAEFSLLLQSGSEKEWAKGSGVKIAYILDLSKPEWESGSANLAGSFSENFSRFHISLIWPIMRSSDRQ